MDDLSLVAAWQRATHHLLSALETELAGLALTPGEINALACFGAERSLAVRELLVRTGQRPSTITGVLDRLEKRGLATRRANPDDRRSILVELEPAGAAAARKVGAAFAAVEARLPAEVRDAAEALRDIDLSMLVAPSAPAAARDRR
jgi:MarR family transcriptional regulator, organic hydroperoxide resistance regulator